MPTWEVVTTDNTARHSCGITSFTVFDDENEAEEHLARVLATRGPGQGAFLRDGPTEVVYGYGVDGCYMQDDTYAEDDADECNVFTESSHLVVAVKRSPRGRWMIDGSDSGHRIPVSGYRKRFATVDDVVAYMTERTYERFTRVPDFLSGSLA